MSGSKCPQTCRHTVLRTSWSPLRKTVWSAMSTAGEWRPYALAWRRRPVTHDRRASECRRARGVRDHRGGARSGLEVRQPSHRRLRAGAGQPPYSRRRLVPAASRPLATAMADQPPRHVTRRELLALSPLLLLGGVARPAWGG